MNTLRIWVNDDVANSTAAVLSCIAFVAVPLALNTRRDRPLDCMFVLATMCLATFTCWDCARPHQVSNGAMHATLTFVIVLVIVSNLKDSPGFIVLTVPALWAIAVQIVLSCYPEELRLRETGIIFDMVLAAAALISVYSRLPAERLCLIIIFTVIGLFMIHAEQIAIYHLCMAIALASAWRP